MLESPMGGPRGPQPQIRAPSGNWGGQWTGEPQPQMGGPSEGMKAGQWTGGRRETPQETGNWTGQWAGPSNQGQAPGPPGGNPICPPTSGGQ